MQMLKFFDPRQVGDVTYLHHLRPSPGRGDEALDGGHTAREDKYTALSMKMQKTRKTKQTKKSILLTLFQTERSNKNAAKFPTTQNKLIDSRKTELGVLKSHRNVSQMSGLST